MLVEPGGVLARVVRVREVARVNGASCVRFQACEGHEQQQFVAVRVRFNVGELAVHFAPGAVLSTGEVIRWRNVRGLRCDGYLQPLEADHGREEGEDVTAELGVRKMRVRVEK